MAMRLIALLALITAGAWAQNAPVQMTFGDYKDLDPRISPDGNLVAFSSNRTQNFDIFVYNYKDKGTYQVTQSPDDDRYPAWSPDNRKILFTSDRVGKGDLFEVAADGGSGQLQITDAEALEEYPDYHPRGEGYVYARSVKKKIFRREMEVVYLPKGVGAVNARRLAEGDEPRFSPDGKKIIFTSRRTKNNDVWLMNTDGSLQTQLTTTEKDDENASFSPKGDQIVFASNRAGNYDIYVMDTDGGNVRQLTSTSDDETQPCWSSGGYIYYIRKLSERRSNLFRIPAP